MKKTKQASVAGYSTKKIAERVAEARSSGWKKLDLTSCRVLESDLEHLLNEPNVERLQWLNLHNNLLSALPCSIGKLTALTALDIGANRLLSIPSEIRNLVELKEFYLGMNQLSLIPSEICSLIGLTRFSLAANRLSSLPLEIGRLTKLTALFLFNNQLSALPPEIGQLTALTTLYVNNNQLSTLPPEIGRLAALTSLHLGENHLSTLPPEIGQLTALKALFLHGNDGLAIPPEILGPTSSEIADKTKPARPADILAYYFRTRKASDRRALNEVKVILVGQGSVGKTSLVKRIVHNTFNKREKKTDGIYIEKTWGVPGKKKGERVQVNFWDFGGQEIMHATHQFFMTKRSVYLLVLDARKGENESNIHYWLKIIRSFGGDAPVLVVTNKCDAHPLDLNETRLRKDYPNIQGFFKTSCEDGTGIDRLKAGIEKQIRSRAMRHVFDPLPKEYFTVKEKLEALAQASNYIDIREYHRLCHDNGVPERDEQDRLLRFLHDLGSVLSFTDPDSPLPVREMSVLNPHWVTQGVYKILNDKALAEAGGELGKDDLPRVLKGRTHPSCCHPFIIGMMHKFELCFTVREDRKWLVTELLPTMEPANVGDWKDALRFEYHYDVLPGGIICRFIVRRYGNLTKPPIYWRSGAVLQFDGCKALVRSDTDKGRMYIAVTGPKGPRRVAVLSVLRDEFARIHATIPNLLPEQMVPLPDDPDNVVPYEHLLTLEQEKVKEFIPQGTKKRYGVAELLDGIEEPELREFGGFHLYPPFFEILPGEESFADAWEIFCCDVLNRHGGTTGIMRYKAPEGGVDLHWAKRGVVYQCKSVLDPTTNRFDLNKAVKSIKAALAGRKEMGWNEFVLCSNVDITGTQAKKLRAACRGAKLTLLTPDFWLPRCREQRRHLRNRFNVLTRIDEVGRLRG